MVNQPVINGRSSKVFYGFYTAFTLRLFDRWVTGTALLNMQGKGSSLIDCYVAKANKKLQADFFKIMSRIAYLLWWKRQQAKRLLSSKTLNPS